jgi:hypothetical protein
MYKFAKAIKAYTKFRVTIEFTCLILMHCLENDNCSRVLSLSVFVILLCILLKYTRKTGNLSPQSLMRFHDFAQLTEDDVKPYAAIVCPLLVLTHFSCIMRERKDLSCEKSNADFIFESRSFEHI